MQDSACPSDNAQLNSKSFDSTAKTAKASKEIAREMTSCLFVYARQILTIFSAKQRTAFHKSMFVQTETGLYRYSRDTQSTSKQRRRSSCLRSQESTC